MRKRDIKKLTLNRETLRPLEGDLRLAAAGSDSIVICPPKTDRICPITTT